MREDQISAKALASMLGVAERTVRDLAERGLVVRASRGRYELGASIRRYCEHLREVAAGRGGEDGILDLAAERARLAKEQADAHAFKNATTRRELVSTADVEREWTSILAMVRGGVLSIPSRVRAQLPHLTNQDVAIIDTTVRDLLARLAADDPPPTGAMEPT